MNKDRGFTIVELLVVIVVIGILAAITIVSYTGISQRAVAASLESDLSNSAKQLKMYQADYGSYPLSPMTNWCPTDPVDDSKYCLKASGSNGYTNYVSNGNTFLLTIINNSTSYCINESQAPSSGCLISIGAISGPPGANGYTVTAGALNPTGATATYQWQSSSDNVNFSNIPGATNSSYVINVSAGTYIRVVASGTGSHIGNVYSASVVVQNLGPP